MSKFMLSNETLECVLRLCISGLCGAVIGMERTKRKKGAGIRTHIIVAIGAALCVLVSKYGFTDVVNQPGVQVDVARVASNVVTGVSFLGAGIISMRGDVVQGLTTAAGIWVTAAIGLSIGSGMYFLGIAATILVLIIQLLLHYGNGVGFDRIMTSRIVVNMEDDPKAFQEFQKLMESKNIKICGSHIKRQKNDTITYSLEVYMPKDLKAEDILEFLKECKNVKSIGM